MMGLVSGARRRATSTTSSRGSMDEGRVDPTDDDTTVVEPEQGNVLMHIISQLRPGADLSRVVLPTFILEPRSMLERITNFMCHPEMLLPIPNIDDPVERFAAVVKFYLSGWHIRPPGVKKPLNPLLGEVFACYWDLPDKTKAYYIAEQTSHHPPKSSYFYMVPEHHIRVDGTLKPRSKFLGNSAASMMEGTVTLTLMNRGQDPSKGERYYLTQPNMYARGILFGKMKYELGDHSYIKCPETGLAADVEFKTKGWVGGTYNAIGGFLRNEKTGENLYELSGMWTGEMFMKNLKTGQKEMFFDGMRSKPSPPQTRPISEQEPRESQRLWEPTVKAVKDRNHELATDEKTKIEDMQRDEAAKRAQDGTQWQPRLFRATRGGPGSFEEGEEDLEWIINAEIDPSDSKKQVEQVLAIYPILPGAKLGAGVTPSQPPAVQQTPLTHHSSQPEQDDLIDFGQNQAPPPAATAPAHTEAARPPNAGAQSTGEISQLLQDTGSKANDGPLLDFHEDMQKSVNAIKRTDTVESNNEFVDAQQ